MVTFTKKQAQTHPMDFVNLCIEFGKGDAINELFGAAILVDSPEVSQQVVEAKGN